MKGSKVLRNNSPKFPTGIVSARAKSPLQSRDSLGSSKATLLKDKRPIQSA